MKRIRNDKGSPRQVSKQAIEGLLSTVRLAPIPSSSLLRHSPPFHHRIRYFQHPHHPILQNHLPLSLSLSQSIISISLSTLIQFSILKSAPPIHGPDLRPTSPDQHRPHAHYHRRRRRRSVHRPLPRRRTQQPRGPRCQPSFL